MRARSTRLHCAGAGERNAGFGARFVIWPEFGVLFKQSFETYVYILMAEIDARPRIRKAA